MKILLGQAEVHPDKPDNSGRTPLSYAAGNSDFIFAQDRCEEVVKLLLGRDEVNPEMPDNHGRTALSYAAETGNDRVVKILLEREEVNPNKPDKDGKTPFMWIGWFRCEKVKALLQPHEALTHTAIRDL